MARKLRTFLTSLGFFDLAIAAPSMKAALEAWGAESDLFHQGAAEVSDDPDIMAAALSRPGVVLRRPVGSSGPFSEHAELPTNLPGSEIRERSRKRHTTSPKQPHQAIDAKAARKAALTFEKEQARRSRERKKQEAARAQQRERREQAMAKAQNALDEAEQQYERKYAAIESERAALDERLQAERERWEKQREKLRTALHRARTDSAVARRHLAAPMSDGTRLTSIRHKRL